MPYRQSIVSCLVIAVLQLATSLAAQETTVESTEDSTQQAADDQQARFERFKEMLSGVKLIGRFTVSGKEDRAASEEEYTITKVTKITEGDYWLFNARIKYGKNDYTVPLPLEVKWAADTPMITLTDLEILGQGPFGARILFFDGKYAGTWSHGQAGGHMFGKIVKLDKENATTPISN